MYIYKEKHSSSSLFSKSDIVSVDKSTYSANFNEGVYLQDNYVEVTWDVFPCLSTNDR